MQCIESLNYIVFINGILFVLDGFFCFCTNLNNNIYWCIRIINVIYDLLYCEFINNFFSYYDFKKDLFQVMFYVKDFNMYINFIKGLFLM